MRSDARRARDRGRALVQLTEDRIARDLDAEIDEGLLLAESAVRMHVKNHVIVALLAADAPWRPETHRPFAEQVLLRIADEQTAAAARMARSYDVAIDSGAGPATEHDYRELDLGLLAKRRTVYRAVAAELRRRAADDAELNGVVEGARADAWFEVGAAIEQRLARQALPAPGLSERLERMVRIRREQATLRQDLAAEVAAREAVRTDD